MAVVAMLAAAPAAATVTFQGVRLYSGSATFLGNQENVYSPQVSSATPGNFSITNDNHNSLNGLLSAGQNYAAVHTVMAVQNTLTGVKFLLNGNAVAQYTGDPQYITPNAASDNQYRYSFSTDTPFDLAMSYDMPTDFVLNSDYYSTYGRFDSVMVCGGALSEPFNCLSTPDLVQYPRNLRQTDVDKTINLHLLPGVYTITIFGNVGAQTYHPGRVSADTSSVFYTNLNPVAAVPEPANWALLIAGFGLTGAALRRRRYRIDYQGSVLPVSSR
jgi:hypothetical protein